MSKHMCRVSIVLQVCRNYNRILHNAPMSLRKDSNYVYFTSMLLLFDRTFQHNNKYFKPLMCLFMIKELASTAICSFLTQFARVTNLNRPSGWNSYADRMHIPSTEVLNHSYLKYPVFLSIVCFVKLSNWIRFKVNSTCSVVRHISIFLCKIVIYLCASIKV